MMGTQEAGQSGALGRAALVTHSAHPQPLGRRAVRSGPPACGRVGRGQGMEAEGGPQKTQPRPRTYAENVFASVTKLSILR